MKQTGEDRLDLKRVQTMELGAAMIPRLSPGEDDDDWDDIDEACWAASSVPSKGLHTPSKGNVKEIPIYMYICILYTQILLLLWLFFFFVCFVFFLFFILLSSSSSVF